MLDAVFFVGCWLFTWKLNLQMACTTISSPHWSSFFALGFPWELSRIQLHYDFLNHFESVAELWQIPHVQRAERSEQQGCCKGHIIQILKSHHTLDDDANVREALSLKEKKQNYNFAVDPLLHI